MTNTVEPLIPGSALAPCSTYGTNLYTHTNPTAAAAYVASDGRQLVWHASTSKWWLLGGWTTSPTDWGDGVPVYTTNEVWSSPDLITWTKILAHDASAPTSGAGARWLPRHTFMVWVVGGYIYVAGSDQYPTKPIPSDVWRSSDGATWERIAADSPWGAQGRTGSDVGVGGVWNPIPGYLGGHFYVMGGHRFTDLVTDVLDWPATAEVWRSADCITWTQLSDMPFVRAGVRDAQTICGKLFVMGGNAGTNTTRSLKSDTWSFNGSSWTRMSGDSRGVWSARDYVATAAFDDKLWVLTGWDGTNAGGCFWSRDLGRTWERAFAATWAGSHADGVAVGNSMIAIASGNGQLKNTYSITVA